MKDFPTIIAALAISASGASLAEAKEKNHSKSGSSGSQVPSADVVEQKTMTPGNLPLKDQRHFWRRWSKK